jgi:hypothetical protein
MPERAKVILLGTAPGRCLGCPGMGCPAVYVVLDDAGVRAWSSRSGGYVVESDVIPGPEYALDRIAGYAPGASPLAAAGWRAGVLVDTRARELLWFGVSDSLYSLTYRRACLAVLAHTWAGWTVRWGPGGAADLDRRAGGTGRVEHWTGDTAGILRQWPLDHGAVVAADAADLVEGWWTLATVQPPDGPAGAWAVAHVEGHPALAGTDLPALLRNLGPGSRHVDSPTPPNAGVHVDVGARTVGWWTGPPEQDVAEELPARWPGWEVSLWSDPPWEDGYDRQVGACRGAVRAPRVGLAGGLDMLEEHLVRLETPVPPAAFAAARATAGA